MKQKILLIEDDRLVSDLYKEVLQSEGFQVTAVDNGLSGYQNMKKGGFDLVLLDVMLPKLDGVEILKKLKKEGHLPKNQKIILLTNLSEEATIKQEERLEVDDYLIKSAITPDELVAKIKDILQI